jgi:hypothetical protein
MCIQVWNQNQSNLPRGAVYIGRPSKWQNPYEIGIDGNRTEVIQKFRAYLYSSGLIKDIHELCGKDLICWCKPKKCHGDILIELANPRLDQFFE